MKFLWNNASRRSRQSFLWRRPSGGIVYPFLIWEGDGNWKPTFVTSPAWDTLLSGPAYKYLNLLSAPAGNTLDGLSSIGATTNNYKGIVTLPPLPASLSVTLTFNISNAVTSISSPTVRAMNLGYPDFDADQLTYMDFPKWEVGSFSLNNFNSVSPTTTRFSFPEYRGIGVGSPQAANLYLNDGIHNFDFPKLVALYALNLENSDPDTYPFTCTFPVLATVESLYITQCTTTGNGKVINLPSLNTVSGNNNCYVLADSFYAPLLATVGAGTNPTFGSIGARLKNLDIALTEFNGNGITVYFDALSNAVTCKLLGQSVVNSHGNIYVSVGGYTYDAADALWNSFSDSLLAGFTAATISGPLPTGGYLNPFVGVLTSRGYTCIFV